MKSTSYRAAYHSVQTEGVFNYNMCMIYYETMSGELINNFKKNLIGRHEISSVITPYSKALYIKLFEPEDLFIFKMFF